jgi:transcriptional regulator with XRE-family HTH domain
LRIVNLKYLYDNAKSFCQPYHVLEVVIMIAERIKLLREQNGKTQADLAKRLGITRSSVNAWEMGISTPSTQYIVELASIFHVSTDYLLGLSNTTAIDVSGLTESDVQIVYALVFHLRDKNKHLPRD